MRNPFIMENYFKFLLGTLVLLLFLITVQDAYAPPPPPPPPSPPTYTDSAHGNSTYGVDRTSLSTFGYSKGNCVHCHEQHASIGGSEPNPTGGPDKYCLLSNNFNTSKTMNPYVQNDSVCFYCHISIGTLQSPSFSNYSYSITFGGNPDITPNNIFDAFNGLSYHNLYDIWRLITGLSGTKTFTSFPADSNPCSGCHNVHIAKRSCGKPSGSFDTTKSAISKPSDHGNLWGDEEKMSNYTTGYQAPYYNSAATYEPDGSAVSDPSKLPDYVTFCTDCHNATNTIYSTLLGRDLYKINFPQEMHGGYAATYCSYNVPPLTSLLAAPYDGLTKCGQYVLACTDCHEPHGSPNNFLVRKWVNKGTVTVTQYGDGDGPEGGGRYGKEWAFLCEKCHTGLLAGDGLTPHHNAGSGLGCSTCHPGGDYRNCKDCHFHGNSTIDGVPYGKPLF